MEVSTVNSDVCILHHLLWAKCFNLNSSYLRNDLSYLRYLRPHRNQTNAGFLWASIFSGLKSLWFREHCSVVSKRFWPGIYQRSREIEGMALMCFWFWISEWSLSTFRLNGETFLPTDCWRSSADALEKSTNQQLRSTSHDCCYFFQNAWMFIKVLTPLTFV